MSPKELPSTSPSSSPDSCEPLKKRGRPRMDDLEVFQDSETSAETKNKIIYRRKYAREYRERIRADLQTKDELRQALSKVEEENRHLRTTLEALKAENERILNTLLQSSVTLQAIAASSRPPPPMPQYPFAAFFR